MRDIKIISAVAALLAIFYIAAGISAILITNIDVNIVAVGALGNAPELWRRNLLIMGTLTIMLGAVALTAAIGTFRLKDWARRLWLGVSPLLLMTQVLFLLNEKLSIDNLIELLLNSIIVLLSCWYLRKDVVKNLFKAAT